MSGVELAAVAAIATAASTVMSGYQSYQEGKQEKKAYDANAAILRRNAAQKRLETSINEDTQRSENRRRISASRAAMGEAGVLNSATTTGALGQMASEAEQNVLNYRFSGESEALNYMNQAQMQNYYGRMAKANGKNAFKMSFLNAGVNGLSTYLSAGGTAGGAPAGDGWEKIGSGAYTRGGAF